jgi:hypothetical protein
MVEVHVASRDGQLPDHFTFVVAAGVAGGGDPSGHLRAGFTQRVDSMGSPELIDAALTPERGTDVYGAAASNENGPIPSGRLRVELRASRMSGRVDTPDGAYEITGGFGVHCFKPEGDHAVVDENHETPLCQRFASLYPE